MAKSTRIIVGVTVRGRPELERVVSTYRDLDFTGLLIELHPLEENCWLVSAYAPNNDHTWEYWREMLIELSGVDVT